MACSCPCGQISSSLALFRQVHIRLSASFFCDTNLCVGDVCEPLICISKLCTSHLFLIQHPSLSLYLIYLQLTNKVSQNLVTSGNKCVSKCFLWKKVAKVCSWLVFLSLLSRVEWPPFYFVLLSLFQSKFMMFLLIKFSRELCGLLWISQRFIPSTQTASHKSLKRALMSFI